MRGWRNWARTVEAEPGAREAPADAPALARGLRSSNGPIRVMGSGHSWSPLGAADAGYTLLHLGGPAFEGLHSEVDAEGQVWVGAATRISTLHGLLARHRRSVANVGSISAQTLAGLVSTGTHGSGRCHPCLSADVTGIRLVTATGEILEVVDPDPALPFLRISLGCLGVITALRIRTVPLFYLAESRVRVPIEAAPELLAAAVADEGRTGLRHRFCWFPYGKRAGILSFAVVPAPDVLPEPFERAPLRVRLAGRLLTEGLFGYGLLGLTGVFPRLTPLATVIGENVHLEDWPTPRVGRLFERVNEHGVPRHRESEWAVPLAAAPEAWRAMRKGIEGRRLPADFLQELRPARADGIPLSAARDGDVCWVSYYQSANHRWEEGLAMTREILGGLGGRPHWGKCFDPKGIAERVGAPFGEFERVRKELDPAGRMLGPWHRALGLG